MNREQRRRMSRRRAAGLAGLSVTATLGMFAGYLGNPRIPRAYAAAACTVTTNADSGVGSLRQALLDHRASAADCAVITFGPIAAITLAADLPVIDSSITITGSGQGITTINGADTFSAFEVDPTGAAVIQLSDLTVTHANSGASGAGALTVYQNGAFPLAVNLSYVGFDHNAGRYGAAAVDRLGTGDIDVSITDSSFSSNTGVKAGGIWLHDGVKSLTVSRSTFSSNADATSNGGAISTGALSNTIGYSVFDANTAGLGGGAIAATYAVTITGSTFTNNTATSYAGGAVVVSADLTVDASTFTGNDSAVYGGALAAGGDVTVTDSSFNTNTSTAAGGAVMVIGTASISGSTFTSNEAPYGAGLGVMGNGTVEDSTFSANEAVRMGGGMAVFPGAGLPGNATVANSTFTGNVSYFAGAALYAVGGGSSITNSTITGSLATYASVLFKGSGSIDFATVSGNVASYVGGVLSQGGTLDITNSIVAGNVSTIAAPPDVVGAGSFTTTYSMFTSDTSISTPTSSAGLLFGDPLLAGLADNGGPTQTMMPADNSPVIDAANPDTSGFPLIDQRGFARITGLLADMGAVEAGGLPPVRDPSSAPPSWHQAVARPGPDSTCPAGQSPSWAEWPNGGKGGWTCEWTTWWDVNKGSHGGWVTTPGFRSLSHGKSSTPKFGSHKAMLTFHFTTHHAK